MPLFLCATTPLPMTEFRSQRVFNLPAHLRLTAIERSRIATAEKDMIAAMEIT